MKQNKLNTLLFLSILLLSAILTSCDITDSLKNCDRFLRFSYIYNMENKELFHDQVECVYVYIFDKNGKYVTTLKEEDATALQSPDYKMPVPYSYNDYQAVVWAGKVTDSYALPIMNVGDSMDKLTLSLASGNASSSNLASLWHGGVVQLTYPDDNGFEQTIPLIRDTNTFNVSLLSNDKDFDSSQFDVQIVSDNGKYNASNDIISNGDVNYTPYSSSNGTFNLSTLRLTTDTKVYMKIIDKATGKPISIDGSTTIDLVQFLLKTKPDGMSDQEYLDRQYIWNLSFNIHYLVTISITVNGWTYWFQNVDN
jgi:hypothetical protein